MPKIELDGTLTIGPGCGASECCPGPGDASTSLGLCLKQDAAATSGIVTRTISSPSAFVTLPALGTGGDVTRAEFLLLMLDSAFTVRLTTDDGSGGDVVETGPAYKLLFRVFPSEKFLKLLEVKGSGRISYAVAGPR